MRIKKAKSPSLVVVFFLALLLILGWSLFRPHATPSISQISEDNTQTESEIDYSNLANETTIINGTKITKINLKNVWTSSQQSYQASTGTYITNASVSLTECNVSCILNLENYTSYGYSFLSIPYALPTTKYLLSLDSKMIPDADNDVDWIRIRFNATAQTNSGYEFSLYPSNSEFELRRWTNQIGPILSSGKKLDNINLPGQNNHVDILRKSDGTIQIKVNGIVVTTVIDKTYFGGSILLGVTPYTGHALIQFTNIQITDYTP